MDGTVKLWDLSSGKERATLEGHTDKVWSAGFSPDGRTLVSTSDDKSIRLWNVATGKQQKLLGVLDNHIYSAVFTSDGNTVVSGDIDGDVRLWDVASGKVLAHLNGHAGVVRLAMTTDGKTLATAGHDRTVKLWDLGTRQLLRVLEGHRLPIERADFSPDGKLLATVSGDFREQRTPGEIKLWDVASGQELLSLQGHKGPVHGVAFAPDGKTLASASADGTAKLWDVSRWALSSPLQAAATPPIVMPGQGGGIANAHPGGPATASASESSEVLLPARQFGPHGIEANCVAYVPGGRQIVSAGADGTLRLWDVASRTEIRRFKGHTGPVEGVAVSPGGDTILSCSQDKTVRLWELATGKEIRRFEGHTGWVLVLPSRRMGSLHSRPARVGEGRLAIFCACGTWKPVARFAASMATAMPFSLCVLPPMVGGRCRRALMGACAFGMWRPGENCTASRIPAACTLSLSPPMAGISSAVAAAAP
jgi:WD40 repeat protein